MVRVLTVFFLIGFLNQGLAQIQPPPMKWGKLNPQNNLLQFKLNNARWKSVLFNGQYFVVLQTDRIADEQLKTDLAAKGIFLKESLSGNHWLAVLKSGFQPKMEKAIKVVYGLPATMKYNPEALREMAEKKGPKDLIAINCFSLDKNSIETTLRAHGATIVETRIKPPHVWFIKAEPESLVKIATLPFVYALSPIHLEDIPLNYNNHAIHSVQALSSPIGRNLTGKNLIIGIGDNANPSTHVDLMGKLIMRTDEPVDDHGTHTAGILAGGGIYNPLYAGMAPRAHLVVNDFSNIIVNSPSYVADYNMSITNNSYYNGAAGCEGEGEYNVLSYYVDSQLLAYPKLLHVFAAGNDGTTTCTPYSTGFATIKSGFQTSKNVLTVGSMYSGGYVIGAGSSRGPTEDGRIKPELVAGGVGVISTVPNNGYGAMTGTSMASPTVAGILALVTERYKQLFGGFNPDGALLKTLVINGAVDLGNPGPDFTYGFGMINGRRTVESLEQNRYFAGTISQGANQEFTIPSVPAGAYQVKITLYWPDVPAVPLSVNTLINDLDLNVTEPGGVNHLPMILDPSAANVNNNAVEGADHTNNIEQVLVNNPPAGNYTLTVKGNSVPAGPQPFYVAYEIIQPSVTLEYPFGGETWVPGDQETLRWSAYGGDANSFSLEYSADAGSSWLTVSSTIASTSRSFIWTVPNSFTNKALFRLTRNVSGYSDVCDNVFTILGQPTLTVTNTCPGYTKLKWKSIPGADGYDILRLSGDTMKFLTHVTDTAWLANALNKDSTYWFSVRATNAGFYGRRSSGQQVFPNTGTCTDGGLDNDLTLDTLITPKSGRQFTSSALGVQRISVHVRNAGNIPSSGSISFSYQVNGATPITETSAATITAHSGTAFQFSVPNSYDFSAPGIYTVKAWISYAADTIPSNDTIQVIIKNLRNDALLLNPSYTEGFESAINRPYTLEQFGLEGLDRADFFNSNSNGRLNTYYNQGFPRSGNRAITMDVTQQGTNAADSLINTFNLSGYTSTDQIWLDLYFKKQSPTTALPGNNIWIRGNDQAAWIPVKSLNDPLDPPGQYIKLNVDVSGTLKAAIPSQTISSSFQVKTGTEGKLPAGSVNPDAVPGGGISFDDFTLTRSQNDLAMLGLTQPNLNAICALGNAEKIVVLIRNYGTDTLFNIPISYAVNQDTVTELIAKLGPGDSLHYNFIKTVDMSGYQNYKIKSWVSLATDNYHNNDSSRDYGVQTTPLINAYPYLEGFESNNGYWYSGGQNNSWQWGKPEKQIIHKAANGNNAWVTSLTGNYNDNELSYLYSPCFDLSTLNKPVLSFSHIWRTEDDCNCDFHWVEYTLNDTVWNLLGLAGQGTGWYNNFASKAWQLSDRSWHVSSYDVPGNPPKIRFRIVMYSDPGVNYEGVGIDDVHVFDKVPVYDDSTQNTLSLPVSGNDWINVDQHGKRILSINPGGQDLGMTQLKLFRDTISIRDTGSQYYGGRSWVIQPTRQPTTDVRVRYYFTDAEARQLLYANTCASCFVPEDAYSLGITQYGSPKISEEDSTLRNNKLGAYLFHPAQKQVQLVPYDNGYYAEMTVNSFSEFWINAGGKNQDQPLAAWLKEFTASKYNISGILNWESWPETGTLKYVIERSADSIIFNKIGETASFQHADSTHSYQFIDPKLAEGNNYYRLVLYFVNGDSLVSPVRKIFEEPIPLELKVYPNPTNGEIQIITPSPCREIQIFDVLGRKLLDRPADGYFQKLSISSFSRGVYFLKLFTDNGNKLIKLEKR